MGAKPYGGLKMFCVVSSYLVGSTLPLHLWRREKHFEACRKMEEQWKREFEEEYQAGFEKKVREEVQRVFGSSS